jgi:cob(I)alamin adenosyltransferase
MTAVSIGTKGGSVDEPEDALARVMNLMQELEKLLLAIKEAAIPVLIGTGEPTAAAQRARSFLRLADRMLEDMNELLRSV